MLSLAWCIMFSTHSQELNMGLGEKEGYRKTIGNNDQLTREEN